MPPKAAFPKRLQTTIMTTLPAHQWAFDEADGTTALDSWGNVNGTLSPTAKRVSPGNFSDKAVQIDGSDGSFINLGKNVGQFGTSDFTVSFWVNTRETLRYFDLIGNRTSVSHGNFFIIRMTGIHEIRAQGTVFCELDEDGYGKNYVAVAGKSGLNDGQWHNIAVVRQGTKLSIYIDGVLTDSKTSAGVTNIANGNDFRIGRSLYNTNTHSVARFSPNACFDDVRIYDKAVSPDDWMSPTSSQEVDIVTPTGLKASLVAGNFQSVSRTGTDLPGGKANFAPLQIKVVTASGEPAAGVKVTFSVASKPGEMVVELDSAGGSSTVVTTDANGIATLNLIGGNSLSCHSASGALLINAAPEGGNKLAFAMTVPAAAPTT
jgi:hypothetical protein